MSDNFFEIERHALDKSLTEVYIKLWPYFNFVPEPLRTNMFVAGGCIQSIMNSNNDHDIDFYFTDPNDLLYYFNLLRQHFLITNEKETNWAVNLTIKTPEEEREIDLVKVYFPTQVKLIQAFDFTVCRASFSGHGKFICDQDFFNDFYAKKINLVHFNNTNGSSKNTHELMRRLKKYLKKGYSIDPEILIKHIDHILPPETEKEKYSTIRSVI